MTTSISSKAQLNMDEKKNELNYEQKDNAIIQRKWRNLYKELFYWQTNVQNILEAHWHTESSQKNLDFNDFFYSLGLIKKTAKQTGKNVALNIIGSQSTKKQ